MLKKFFDLVDELWMDWFDRHFHWHERYVDETPYAERKEDYVFHSVLDNIIYKKVKRKVAEYRPYRKKCLYGWVIFSGRSYYWSKNITVTSEVLARLA